MLCTYFRSLPYGFYIPVVCSDELYHALMESQDNHIEIYDQRRNFEKNASGREQAEEWALEFAERIKDTCRTYGMPVAFPAYWSDHNEDYNKFGLFEFPGSNIPAGTYPLKAAGASQDETKFVPMTVTATSAHTSSSSSDPSLGKYGPCYDAHHSSPAPGFWGYGLDTWTALLLPSGAYKNGRLSVSDLEEDLYYATITTSVGYQEYTYNITASAEVDAFYSTASASAWRSWLLDNLDGADVIETNDPFARAGMSESDGSAIGSIFSGIGGGGTFQRSSDSIGWASTPVISAADTGLVTLYVGSASNMQHLANFLWSGLFDVDTFKKLFISPMDCIIGASMLPVTPPHMDSATIIFGNVDTEVGMPRATQTYVTVDCGSVSLKEYWQAYLDYSPYTKVHIYLPFVGFKELNTDEVMGKNIGVRYMIDCLSGAFTVQVGVDSGATILAQYSGSCAVQVPLTANNWGNAISSVIQVAGQAIGGFASGGAAGALMSAGLGAANNAISGGFKPEIQRNGSVTGAGGWMASNKPYIIIEWPRQSKPESLNRFEGYPSNTTLLLGACRGFTKVEEINLDGIPATAPELEEIESLLKGGVLI